MAWGILNQIGPEEDSERLPSWEFTDSDDRCIVVGRTSENTFALAKPYVSAKHFSISAVSEEDGQNKYKLTDFSSNGTFLNGARVGKGNSSDIQPGDKIALKFKGKIQIEFEFSLPNATNKEEDGVEEPPSKSQRTAGGRKRASLHRIEDEQGSISGNGIGGGVDSVSAMRIATLERDNELQEQRIHTYTTKLEAHAREMSNLKRDLSEAREHLAQKESALEEERQHRLVMESGQAATEARCRSLDETVGSLRTQVCFAVSAGGSCTFRR